MYWYLFLGFVDLDYIWLDWGVVGGDFGFFVEFDVCLVVIVFDVGVGFGLRFDVVGFDWFLYWDLVVIVGGFCVVMGVFFIWVGGVGW